MMKSGHRSSHQRIDPRCRRSGVAAGPGRIDSDPREGGVGGGRRAGTRLPPSGAVAADSI